MGRMRHYDRAEYRHLDDADHFRDYDYLADDSWVGPNERSPEREPPPPAATATAAPARPRRAPPAFETPSVIRLLMHPRETLRRTARSLLERLRLSRR